MNIKVDILDTETVEYAKHYHKKAKKTKKENGTLIAIFKDAGDSVDYGYVVVGTGAIEKHPLEHLKVVDNTYIRK